MRGLVLSAEKDFALSKGSSAFSKAQQTSLAPAKTDVKVKPTTASPAKAAATKPPAPQVEEAHESSKREVEWTALTDRWEKFLLREMQLDHEQQLVDAQRAKLVKNFVHASLQGRIQSLYLPSDYSPSFGMLQSYWKTFTSRPPSRFPGMGMAQTSDSCPCCCFLLIMLQARTSTGASRNCDLELVGCVPVTKIALH